jgi:glutaredoxin 3
MFLDQHNIAYQEVDVATDSAAREEMVQKTGKMAVPVIEIDGNIIVGFNEAQIKEKLGL